MAQRPSLSRIVITGVGLTAPNGNNLAEYRANLLAGKAGGEFIELRYIGRVPGQQDHPDMQAAIQKMLAACQRHHVYPAIHINDLKLAVYWAQQGMRLVSSNAEIGLLVKAGQEVTAAIGEAMGR